MKRYLLMAVVAAALSVGIGPQEKKSEKGKRVAADSVKTAKTPADSIVYFKMSVDELTKINQDLQQQLEQEQTQVIVTQTRIWLINGMVRDSTHLRKEPK